MQKPLFQFFRRDIQKLYKEIELYQDESQLWEILGGTSNS